MTPREVDKYRLSRCARHWKRVSMFFRVLASFTPLCLMAACAAPAPPAALEPASPPLLPPGPVESTASPAVAQAAVCSAACTGSVSPELATALRDAARRGSACYNRALRRADVHGSMLVKVQIEAS